MGRMCIICGKTIEDDDLIKPGIHLVGETNWFCSDDCFNSIRSSDEGTSDGSDTSSARETSLHVAFEDIGSTFKNAFSPMKDAFKNPFSGLFGKKK